MDNLVTLFHGGSVAIDDYGNVQFGGMQIVPLLFMSWPSFSELVARSREELHCDANEEDIVVEGLLHFGSKDAILRRMISIGCEDQWEKYVTLVMSNDIKCLDLFVQKVSIDPTSHGYSPELGNPAPFDPPLPNLEVNVEDVPELPDALSASNEVQISKPVRVECQTDVVAAPQEIPLTHNHPRDIPGNVGGQLLPPYVNFEEACRGSNGVDVQIMDDVEPYGTAIAVDSDDDSPVGELTESDTKLLRTSFCDHDPLVSHFSDLSDADKAWSEGRDDELINTLEPGPSMTIQKGLVFASLPALKIWLQEYSVRHNRPFKVRHSYAEQRYTVVCEKEQCDWRVCARKQKNTGKFKITRVISPHTCRSAQLTDKHPKLTSTLIATSLYRLGVEVEPNLRVRAIIEMVEKEWKYKITYGKA